MSDITYPNKQVAVNPLFPQPNEKWTAANANEVKTAVNSKVDKIDGYGLSENNLTDDLLQEIAELKAEQATKPEITITGGGSGSSGSDSSQFSEKTLEAIEFNKKLIIPAPDKGKYYRLTETLEMKPYSTNQEFYLDIEAHGIPRRQIRYDGPEGTPCIRTIAHRYGLWTGVKIALENKVGLIAFDIDTLNPGANNIPPSRGSNTHNTYINCHVAMGNMVNQNQKGWRIGYESGGGGDISDLSWINSSVYGHGGLTNENDYGWHIYGGNTLQNTWTNAFGAFLGKMYSNISDVPDKTGNGASYFFGTGTSQNLIDFEIGNSQSYLISGGRFESGKQVIKVGNSNISPAITLNGVNIDDYEGIKNNGDNNQRCLFYLDMPGSLSLDNVNIKAGRWDAYNENMIVANGGGGNQVIGRILVRGGAIQATDKFYKTGTEPAWVVDIKTVARLDASGRAISMFTNV